MDPTLDPTGALADIQPHGSPDLSKIKDPSARLVAMFQYWSTLCLTLGPQWMADSVMEPHADYASQNLRKTLASTQFMKIMDAVQRQLSATAKRLYPEPGEADSPSNSDILRTPGGYTSPRPPQIPISEASPSGSWTLRPADGRTGAPPP